MSFTQKAELHCHSNNQGNRSLYAPFISDSVQTIEQIIKRCLILNIKILSVTEHDSLNGYRVAKKYIEENKLDILLIPGCEVTSKEGHILAYNIKKEIPKKLSAQETIDLIHKQGGIAVVAHPFMIKSTGKKLFDLNPDAIEGLNAAVPMYANHQAIKAAVSMQIPYTSSSDAHNKHAVGDGCTVFPSSVKTAEDFANCVKTGNFSIKFKHSSYLKMITENIQAIYTDIVTGKISKPLSEEAQFLLNTSND